MHTPSPKLLQIKVSNSEKGNNELKKNKSIFKNVNFDFEYKKHKPISSSNNNNSKTSERLFTKSKQKQLMVSNSIKMNEINELVEE